MSIFETIKNGYQAKKAQDDAQRDFIRNHKGTQAICEYMQMLFDKNNAGYDWVKRNRTGLYPIVKEDCVILCYMHINSNPQSFRDACPKDQEVGRYTFQEMYNWYGLRNGEGFQYLSSRLQKKTLETCISNKVQDLPHITYNNGFRVKLFC